MSTARKILSNTFAQFVGKIMVAILGLAVVKISTSYLSVEGYGEYVLVYEFLAFFGIAADLGLFTIAVREMSKDEKELPKIIGNILSLRTILVFAVMLVAVIVAFQIPKYENTLIPFGVAIASITTILTILNGTITSVLQTKLRMEIASISTVIGKLFTVGFMVYVVFFGFPTNNSTGFLMLIVAGIIGNLVTVLITNHYVRKITPLKYQFDFKLWKRVLKEALPYGLALILNTVYFRIDSLFISFFRGQGEVGVYGVAMKMLENFAVLPIYFMNSVLPILTKAVEEKSNKYKAVIAQSFNFLAALSIPIVVGGVILAYPIIFVVSTPDYLSRISEGFYGSDIAFQILVFALLFQFLNVLFAFILIAVGKQSKLLYINAVCVVFNIVTNIIFIPKYGFIGAGVTSVLSEMLILIGNYTFAKHYLNFKINFKKLFTIIFSALVMGVVVYFSYPFLYNYIQNWSIILVIPLGAIIYGTMLVITKTIDRDMLALVRKGSK